LGSYVADFQARKLGLPVENDPAELSDDAAQPACEVLIVGVDVAAFVRQRHRQ
jgi:hypothetical protein